MSSSRSWPKSVSIAGSTAAMRLRNASITCSTGRRRPRGASWITKSPLFGSVMKKPSSVPVRRE